MHCGAGCIVVVTSAQHSAVHQSVKGASYLYLDTLLTMRIGQLDRMTTRVIYVGILGVFFKSFSTGIFSSQVEYS